MRCKKDSWGARSLLVETVETATLREPGSETRLEPPGNLPVLLTASACLSPASEP